MLWGWYYPFINYLRNIYMRKSYVMTNNADTSLNKRNRFFYFRLDIVCIIFLVTVTHFLLLCNDGVYWDGWIIYHCLVGDEWNLFYKDWSGYGHAIVAHINWAMKLFPDIVFGHKITTFISLLGSTVCVYLLAIYSGLLSRLESLSLSFIFVAYPAYQIWVELVYMPMVFLYFIFLLAWLLTIKRIDINDRIFHGKRYSSFVIRLASLVLFFIAFNYNAFLVFYSGFFLYLILYEGRSLDVSLRFKCLSSYRSIIFKNLDYFLLPFIYWIYKKSFFEWSDSYSNYYGIKLNLIEILKNFYKYIDNAVFYQFKNSVNFFARYPLLLIILLVVFILVFFRKSFLKKGVNTVSAPNTVLLLFFGIILLISAIFPYAAIGGVPNKAGWLTRYSLFSSLPVSILLITLSRGFYASPVKFRNIALHLRSFLLVLLIAGFVINTMSNYVAYQKRWIKDRSVMFHLSRDKTAGDYSTYIVKDSFGIIHEQYRTYEWNGMFKKVWGDETRMGGTDALLEYYSSQIDGMPKKLYLCSDYDPDGPRAFLDIKPGPIANDSKVVYQYIYYRLMGDENKINKLLQNFTVVQVKAVD